MSRTLRTQRGDQGEERVASFLKSEGFDIVARNYRRPYGEIDVIAQCGELLIFVEVKTRAQELFDLSEVITPTKQRKIIAAAKAFITEHQCDDKVCRFDVALLEDSNDGKMSYIPNAFNGE